jgi:hypothetical protein
MGRPTGKWWRAYGALHGKQIDLIEAPVKPRHINTTPLEDNEQMVAACWLDKHNILYYHCPNGGKRSYAEACKFKAMGVKAGVPDICIPIPRSSHHGLYIELKRQSGGVLSEAQKWWRDQLIKNGYAWYEAHGAQDLINHVKNYLGVVE